MARFIILGFGLVLSVCDVRAQYEGGGNITYEVTGAASRSLTAGFAAVDASYAPNDSVRSVSLVDLNGYGVRLAGRNISLTAAHAGSDGGGETVAAALSLGPQITPYAYRGDFWANVRIPIRFDLGYDYIRPDSSQVPDVDLSSLHVGHVGAGLGLALDASVATKSNVAREISGLISFVLTPGILSKFSEEPFETVFAQRSSEFDIEVRASSIGGSGVGLALGYTLLTTRVGTSEVTEFGDVLDAVTADGFNQQRRVGMFRAGLAF